MCLLTVKGSEVSEQYGRPSLSMIPVRFTFSMMMARGEACRRAEKSLAGAEGRFPSPFFCVCVSGTSYRWTKELAIKLQSEEVAFMESPSPLLSKLKRGSNDLKREARRQREAMCKAHAIGSPLPVFYVQNRLAKRQRILVVPTINSKQMSNYERNLYVYV